MLKNSVLFGYALLDDSRQTVNINDIDHIFARQHFFRCPHCHCEMYATFGKIQRPHFRHNRGKCAPNNYIHDLAEQVFYEEYKKCLDNGEPFFLELSIPLPCNHSCVLKRHANCRERYSRKTVDLTRVYRKITLESRVSIDDHYRRPDILLETADGKQLWVEIWVSHETDELKRNEGRIIELKINTEEDLEPIKRHKLVQSEGKKLAVRIFNSEEDWRDIFYNNEDSKPSEKKYPCERYYCFEVGAGGFKSKIIDHIITNRDESVLYRILLLLNWKGNYMNQEGISGKELSEDDLLAFCLRKYNSYCDESHLILENAYNTLIESEWKAEPFNPVPIPIETLSLNIPSLHFKSTQKPNLSITTISEMEWIDLGLPSGILWSTKDIENKMGFNAAKREYPLHLPSKQDIAELRELCTKKWDNDTKELIFIGPNGNSISFSCEKDEVVYWLNEYENGEIEFGQCFRIIQRQLVRINDKTSYTPANIRLVTR